MEKLFIKLPLTPNPESGLEYTNTQNSVGGFIQTLINTVPGEFQADKDFGWKQRSNNPLKHIPELLHALHRYEKRINKVTIAPVNLNGYPHLELTTWIVALNNLHIFQIPLQ